MVTGFEWNGMEVSVARVAEHLRAEGFYVSTFEGRHTYMVEARPMTEARSGRFLVWDNGGEIGVELINSGELARFVPTRWFGRPVGPITMLVRLKTVLRGEEVDWEENLDDPPVIALS